MSDLIGLFEMVEKFPQGYANTSTRVLVLLGMLTPLVFYITLALTIHHTRCINPIATY
jgi:hypothetical protein